MEYLAPEMPDSSGWFTMRFLMQSIVKQAEHASESLMTAPDHLPQMLEHAKHLVRSAHKVHFSDSHAAHGDVRPDNIMVRIKDSAVMDLKLIDMDWAGIVGTARYPSLQGSHRHLLPQSDVKSQIAGVVRHWSRARAASATFIDRISGIAYADDKQTLLTVSGVQQAFHSNFFFF